jgi:hypothetical protein
MKAFTSLVAHALVEALYKKKKEEKRERKKGAPGPGCRRGH